MAGGHAVMVLSYSDVGVEGFNLSHDPQNGFAFLVFLG